MQQLSPNRLDAILRLARQIDGAFVKYSSVSTHRTLADYVSSMDTRAINAVIRVESFLRRHRMLVSDFVGAVILILSQRRTQRFSMLQIGNADLLADVQWGAHKALLVEDCNNQEVVYSHKTGGRGLVVISLLRWMKQHGDRLANNLDGEDRECFVLATRLSLHPVWLYDLESIRLVWQNNEIEIPNTTFSQAALQHMRWCVGQNSLTLRNFAAYQKWAALFGERSKFYLEVGNASNDIRGGLRDTI